MRIVRIMGNALALCFLFAYSDDPSDAVEQDTENQKCKQCRKSVKHQFNAVQIHKIPAFCLIYKIVPIVHGGIHIQPDRQK